MNPYDYDPAIEGRKEVAAEVLEKLEPILADAVGWPHADKLRELVRELKAEVL